MKLYDYFKRHGFFKTFKTGYYYAVTKVGSKLNLKRKFVFNDEEYEYFYHDYNQTFSNERCVEIPIFETILNDCRMFVGKGCKILEIGNVMSHYYDVKHEIVDKYENSDNPNVTNLDVMELDDYKTYDLIFAISTIEHIGYDEEDENEHNPVKVKHAVEKLKRKLKSGGKLVVSFPKNFNKHIDAMVEDGSLGLEYFFMKRISYLDWKQVDSFEGDDVLVIGVYVNDDDDFLSHDIDDVEDMNSYKKKAQMKAQIILSSVLSWITKKNT